MNIDLRYGRTGLTLTLPNFVQVDVIRKPAMPLIEHPAVAVRESLDKAVAAAPFSALAGQANSACIAICDITRPVPNHLFLRPMIEQLQSAGLGPNQITVLVATGLHRPNEGRELHELVGDDWVFMNAQVVNHHARDDSQHVDLGTTPKRGTPVRLDRRFVEADLRVVTGLVEPHFMAGYSGGRKVIAPGLAHADTITVFHNARFMSDPATANCNFLGNPLHEEQVAIVAMLGKVYALNTVIDEFRQLSFVNFGEVIASHANAVEFARKYCEVSVARRYPTVISCAAGYPLDKTYYQTIKGMVGALDILEPGGDLIMVSECSEGLGSAEFIDAQRRLVSQGPEAFVNTLMAKHRADIDEWQSQMQVKAMQTARIELYAPHLSDADHTLTGVRRIVNLPDRINEILRRHGNDRIAIIPEGPYVVPIRQRSQRVF